MRRLISKQKQIWIKPQEGKSQNITFMLWQNLQLKIIVKFKMWTGLLWSLQNHIIRCLGLKSFFDCPDMLIMTWQYEANFMRWIMNDIITSWWIIPDDVEFKIRPACLRFLLLSVNVCAEELMCLSQMTKRVSFKNDQKCCQQYWYSLIY